ncbi:MAG: DUF4270 domain-containing protein [Crocinitomicaceae bacterium]|jgi:hypothetical protein|nr:DUF4270 domain-containing protein [Crocinitomicaceae bacterium]MDP4722775.1 DUF4270 domain-containing protein [Crocinitomicaceae bacterium]MDP4739533.1 DUF4270 domain-containing protein [Crocinitomicaceae bacterium]MDP4798721.1 DUF4270 domain-containing protein [Crocinitomicaceae bacterium]MDP4807500.1 DUF4270 domain-containing protein [Crocinitomicaceae bacterium]
MKSLSALLLLLLVATACNKQDSGLGKDIIDPNALLNGTTTDTFELITYSIVEDSTETKNASNVLLGSYVDPKFGKVEASVYTELRLPGLNPDFGDASLIVIDSFVLALEYVGYYGDLSAQTFEVYELTDSLQNAATVKYYQFSTLNTGSTNWVAAGQGTITPDPINDAVVAGAEVDPQLRIQLDTNRAWDFINESNTNPATFATNAAFQDYFKGLKIAVNNPNQNAGQGAILYLDINNNPASKMTIYFTVAGVKKTYDFTINSNCADFTHIDHEQANTPVAALLADSTIGQKAFYAQANKVRAMVKIPGLDHLPDNIVIHRADLSLPVQFQTGYRYKPGSRITAASKLSATDVFYTSLGIAGLYSDTKKQYDLDIRAYLQSLVNGKLENTGIVVSPLFFRNSAERIVFNGVETNNKKKPKLVVTYTTY